MTRESDDHGAQRAAFRGIGTTYAFIRALAVAVSVSWWTLGVVNALEVGEDDSPFAETEETLGPKVHAGFDDEDAIEKITALKVEAKAGLGYRSNIFEVNEEHGSPVGDWFSDVGLDLAMPLRALPEGFSIGLVSFSKRFFRQHSADEYLVKANVQWVGQVADGTAVAVTAFGARFQEGQFFQFGRVLPQAQVGWLSGVRLVAKSRLSERLQLTTEATSEYRLFQVAPEDNLQDTAELGLAYQCDHGITATIAGEVHDSHYRRRPPEDEGVRNPAKLDTVEERAHGRMKWAVSPAWTIQGELAAGANNDLTNGYYDARVVAGGLEVRYKKTPWEITLATEPELALFARRPANYLQQRRRLATAEYVLELRAEYRLTDTIHLYAAEAFKTVITNAAEAREDVTVNSFRTNAVGAGLQASF